MFPQRPAYTPFKFTLTRRKLTIPPGSRFIGQDALWRRSTTTPYIGARMRLAPGGRTRLPESGNQEDLEILVGKCTLVVTAWTFLVLSLALPAAAQQATLSGTVTDAESGAPVAQAQIQILGGGESRGAISGPDGRYEAQLPAGTYDLVVRLLGYVGTRFENVSVAAGETTTYPIVITSTVLALDEVVVSASRAAPEKATEAPATTHLISSTEIAERPTPTISDHLRSAPGVDVITTGLQSTNVVVRGFNNLFSGALHMLTDHRLAGVPALRVNLPHFIPANEEDIDRIEVVLGPGSALYGPNTANGVVHVLTKSPLTSQGTSVTLGGGEQSVLQGSYRSAFLVSENLGVKISGQYLTGEDWEYVDPDENAARMAAQARPEFCQADRTSRGLDPASAQAACSRVGVRDFDIQRWSVEARSDWRFSETGTLVGTYGRTSSSGIEMTGLGAAQSNGWIYEFFQARLNVDRFFAQAYYNTTDSGGTSYLLRDGTALADASTLFVAQAQQGISIFDDVQDFTFGVDYFRTRPETFGQIYGINEDDDDTDEWGVYLQSETALSPRLRLILAGRVDAHSHLADNVWSPRAALVFQPRENQSLRLTYNRAFSTPTSLNLFVDISGGFAPEPLGSLGYSTRAFGTGKNGWSLQNADGTLRGMRSPFTPAVLGGPGQLLPADPSVLWPLAVGILQAQGAIDAQQAALLGSLSPTANDIGLLLLDPVTSTLTPAAAARLPDVPPLHESYTESFELGWTAVIGNRVSVSADVYRMKKNDFVSPLLIQTPLILLNGQDVGNYLAVPVGTAVTQQLMAAGMDPATAQAAAASVVGELATGIGSIPLGVVSSDETGSHGPDLVGSYRNVGDVEVMGADLGVQAFLSDAWSVSGTYSWVDKDYFQTAAGPTIALNAPKQKGTLGLAYRNLSSGLSASVRGRYTGAFPAQSTVFVGTRCITGDPGEDDCIDAATLLDLTAGYQVPNTRATLQLSVNNVLDTRYRSFVGVPEVGRFAMLRVKYDLF